MMNIPAQTAGIFDILSKGQFICSNSTDDTVRKLFNIIDEQFEELHVFFSAIGFVLEKGDEFFYFSRYESRSDLERKIEQAYRWIDTVDFFKAFDNAFGAGYRLSPSQVEVQLRIDANLKDKLESMRKVTGEGTYPERVKKLVDLLAGYGYAELENEISQQYKVLSSFKYLEQLILSIHIPEEVQHEIPQ